MAETVQYGSPILTDPGAATFRISLLTNQVWPDQIHKTVFSEWDTVGAAFVPNGKSFSVVYTGAAALAIILTIGTGNYNTVPLRDQLIAQYITDGKLVGVTVI